MDGEEPRTLTKQEIIVPQDGRVSIPVKASGGFVMKVSGNDVKTLAGRLLDDQMVCRFKKIDSIDLVQKKDV